MPITKDRIRRREEMADCAYCGYPLDLDDTAWFDMDCGRAYCCRTCYERDRQRFDTTAISIAR